MLYVQTALPSGFFCLRQVNHVTRFLLLFLKREDDRLGMKTGALPLTVRVTLIADDTFPMIHA